MKLRYILIFLVVLLFSQSAVAQEKFFAITVHSKDTLNNLKLYINPLHPSAGNKAKELKPSAEGIYTAIIPESENSFYSLVGVKNSSQIFTTLYLPIESDTIAVETTIDGYYILSNETADNNALGEYRRKIAACSRNIWNCDIRNDNQMRSLLGSIISAADSIIATGSCSEPVNEYIRLWSYTAVYNNMYSVQRIARNAGYKLPYTAYDIIGNVRSSFDCDIATVFPESYAIINDGIPRDASLSEKLEHLYNTFGNNTIRKRVSATIIEKFLDTYNYSSDFDGGLNQLKDAVKKYGADEKYIKAYEARRATIKGTPFPQGVQLRDAGGNVVDFSTFKGKYVYIDMWASWCGPCRKEIPHLKKLEEELQNDNVVFVSISIDKDETAWKKSIVEHDLHGYQFIDSDNKLGSALNVRGIPFFVIYDKEGCLYMHDAPRPSSGTPLKEMLEGLH